MLKFVKILFLCGLSATLSTSVLLPVFTHNETKKQSFVSDKSNITVGDASLTPLGDLNTWNPVSIDEENRTKFHLREKYTEFTKTMSAREFINALNPKPYVSQGSTKKYSFFDVDSYQMYGGLDYKKFIDGFLAYWNVPDISSSFIPKNASGGEESSSENYKSMKYHFLIADGYQDGIDNLQGTLNWKLLPGGINIINSTENQEYIISSEIDVFFRDYNFNYANLKMTGFITDSKIEVINKNTFYPINARDAFLEFADESGTITNLVKLESYFETNKISDSTITYTDLSYNLNTGSISVTANMKKYYENGIGYRLDTDIKKYKLVINNFVASTNVINKETYNKDQTVLQAYESIFLKGTVVVDIAKLNEYIDLEEIPNSIPKGFTVSVDQDGIDNANDFLAGVLKFNLRLSKYYDANGYEANNFVKLITLPGFYGNSEFEQKQTYNTAMTVRAFKKELLSVKGNENLNILADWFNYDFFDNRTSISSIKIDVDEINGSAEVELDFINLYIDNVLVPKLPYNFEGFIKTPTTEFKPASNSFDITARDAFDSFVDKETDEGEKIRSVSDFVAFSKYVNILGMPESDMKDLQLKIAEVNVNDKDGSIEMNIHPSKWYYYGNLEISSGNLEPSDRVFPITITGFNVEPHTTVKAIKNVKAWRVSASKALMELTLFNDQSIKDKLEEYFVFKDLTSNAIFRILKDESWAEDEKGQLNLTIGIKNYFEYGNKETDEKIFKNILVSNFSINTKISEKLIVGKFDILPHDMISQIYDPMTKFVDYNLLSNYVELDAIPASAKLYLDYDSVVINNEIGSVILSIIASSYYKDGFLQEKLSDPFLLEIRGFNLPNRSWPQWIWITIGISVSILVILSIIILSVYIKTKHLKQKTI